jgi:disulfide bond formation protein DsbB
MNINGFFLVFIIVSTGLLGSAFGLQYIFDIHPCSLCIYQRYPWIIIILFSFIGLFLKKSISRIIVAAIFVTLLTSLALSIYHVGIEQKWWANHLICKSAIDTENFESFKQQLMKTEMVDCAKIQWSLFGISMAGFNAMISAILAVFVSFKWKKIANRYKQNWIERKSQSAKF